MPLSLSSSSSFEEFEEEDKEEAETDSDFCFLFLLFDLLSFLGCLASFLLSLCLVLMIASYFLEVTTATCISCAYVEDFSSYPIMSADKLFLSSLQATFISTSDRAADGAFASSI
jgi:hypothetical protein